MGKARAAVSALALLLGSCDGSSSAPAPETDVSAELAALIAALEPPAAIATSDVQDAWFKAKTERIERLRGGPRELGRAALREFASADPAQPAVRVALLDVGAHCAPEEAAPLLESLISTYDPKADLGLRTVAVDLLARTSPARAVERFEPMLRESQPRATRPPQEALVRAWALAARAESIAEPRVLCDVAVDLTQPADARYAAIDELGRFGGLRAQKALEEVFREASSDGLMRRKAAQALATFAPKEELCALLQRAAETESDENFLLFLASMLDRYCAG